jgi:ppGpp synthetase/RelA/SpoT-type nucleotidyltranferase
MASSVEQSLLEEYRRQQSSYNGLASTVSDLLEKIVAEQGVSLHSVTHRVKDEASLARKLSGRGRSYEALTDVTELAGVRVTTYFHDHVDLVASVVEKEFAVDQKNSVDKRGLLDPDRFGYLSVHYVVELSPQRCSLPEYKRFKGLKVEIQVRSLLQHVWAEIEHDLGYKSSQSVPSTIRRRFARLAGLLELADAEFVAIREALAAYEKEVPGLIARAPASVPIDKASLTAFEKESDLVAELDAFIGSLVGAKIVIPEDPQIIDTHLGYLSFMGIASIGALEEELREYQTDIERFARVWLEASRHETLYRGICIFYLSYVRLARQRDPKTVLDWLNRFEVGREEERNALPDRVFATAAKVGIIETAV